MRVAVTGTPGTGKTTATELLADRFESTDEEAGEAVPSPLDLELIHLNDVVEAEDLYTSVDAARDSVVADLDAIAGWLDGDDDVVIESHLAHRVDADRVAVLRCRPDVLEDRLLGRGEPRSKARENAESEALDVVLAEAVERHGRESVYEIDTTDRTPAAVADVLEATIRGEREPSTGEVDFLEYVEPGQHVEPGGVDDSIVAEGSNAGADSTGDDESNVGADPTGTDESNAGTNPTEPDESVRDDGGGDG